MSTNDKNKIRNAFLMNFTNEILYRILVAADTFDKKQDIIKRIGELNEDINFKIQNLNLLIKERNIPYIKVKPVFSKQEFEDLERDTRIIINTYPVDEILNGNIIKRLQVKREEISHIVDVLIAPGQNRFCVSSLSCDAKLVLDYPYFNNAIEDILLDICMFNSYSFLCDMDIQKKKDFSKKKLQYCKCQENCFNDVEMGNQEYFSLAFAARDKEGELSLEQYILVWDKFIKDTFPKRKHIEKSIKEQLERHKDIKELPKNCNNKISQNSPGTYLLLRTNKDVTEKIHPQLYALFGINKRKYRKGLLKLVPIEEYQNIIPLLENLDVSAFKVIVE